MVCRRRVEVEGSSEQDLKRKVGGGEQQKWEFCHLGQGNCVIEAKRKPGPLVLIRGSRLWSRKTPSGSSDLVACQMPEA